MDFHSHIQQQPNVNNIEWSDDDCDYVFVSSAVVSCETASSPNRKVTHMTNVDKICWFILFALITQIFPWAICLMASFNIISVLGCITYSVITLSLIGSITIWSK